MAWSVESKAMALDTGLSGHCTFNRAVAFANLKHFPQAFADCNALIKREPKASSFYRLRSWVYARSGQYELAEKDYQTELKLHAH